MPSAIDPTESRDDVLARIERDHGVVARRVAERAIDAPPVSPRARPRTAGTAPIRDGAKRARVRRGAVTGPAIADPVNRGRSDEHDPDQPMRRMDGNALGCSTDGCDHRRAPASLYCVDCSAREWRRRNNPRGTRTGRPLTADEVAEAKRMLSRFRTRRAIAAHFGCSLSTLRNHGV